MASLVFCSADATRMCIAKKPSYSFYTNSSPMSISQRFTGIQECTNWIHSREHLRITDSSFVGNGSDECKIVAQRIPNLRVISSFSGTWIERGRCRRKERDRGTVRAIHSVRNNQNDSKLCSLSSLESENFQSNVLWSVQLKGARFSKDRLITRAAIDIGYEFEDAFGSLILPPPPEPVLYPRKMLNLKFAVLLMRSAYEAVDALDFIPMDKFQIKFWKLRQSEVEPYSLQCRPLRVKYGDLTDPLYFDFISFSQFATISNEMKTGEIVFQEKMGSDGEVRIVRRDERLRDNALLPAAFNDKAGQMLYQRLVEGSEGEVFDVPLPCETSSDLTTVIDGVRKLLQVFIERGYALKANVEPVQSSPNKRGKLRVRLEGSATQWSVRSLASRRALLVNDFAALAVGAYLLASGLTASHKVRYTDTATEQLWTLA